MREDKNNEKEDSSLKDDRKRLAAMIPISEWYDLERNMEIMSRMTTAQEPPTLDRRDVSP